MEVSTVVRLILEQGELTQKEFAKCVGVSQGTVSKWLSGQQEPNKRQWDSVLALIKSNPHQYDIEIEDEDGFTVPVMGRVGAGATIEPEFDQVPAEGLFQVKLPFPVPDEMIGLEVEGDSMLPVYRAGDVIVVWREQRRSTDDFLGELAAVRTEDGRRFLKTIMRGSQRGLYRLESFNARPIEDVEIAWVGEIHVIVPSRQVRQVDRAVRTASARRQHARERETAGMKRLV